jgi:hypothetical protein
VKRLWIFIASIFAVAALILFLRNDYDKAFIAAALGAVSWMLSYRDKMREIVKTGEQHDNDDDSFGPHEEE